MSVRRTLIIFGAMVVACIGLAVISAPAQATTPPADPGVRVAPQDQMAVGTNHTCAIDAGDVRCWGRGDHGQLGYGNTDNIGDNEHPSDAGTVDIGGKAIAVTAGSNHTCALRADGRVLCWGASAGGQLGYGNTQTIGDDETPAAAGPVNIGREVIAISAGEQHTCALMNNGQIRCWGVANQGRLGYANNNIIGDNEVPSSVPSVQVGGLVIAVAAGGTHTCAVLSTGKVRCWGRAQDGELGTANLNFGWPASSVIGDNEHPSSAPTVKLPGGEQAVAITAGQAHTCAILDTGGLTCWGRGSDLQLGYGNAQNIGDDEHPGLVGLGRPAIAVTAGYRHTCAVLANGETRCWGSGANGRLGLANTNDVHSATSVPPVSLGKEVVAVSAGTFHTCARLADGNIRCWGLGSGGLLGSGNTGSIGDDEHPSAVPPVQLGVSPYPVTVTSGESHSCALISNGDVKCWGFGGGGRLGYANTTTIGDNEAPATAGAVSLGGEAKSITAGARHTCAVLANGDVRCWGVGVQGRLGLAATDNIGDDEHPSSVPPVDVGQRAVAVTAGDEHTCALIATGGVRCWGNGAMGRLGYANVGWVERTVGDDEHPRTAGDVDISADGLTEQAKAITAGPSHTCAILGNGRVRCWGNGANGRLGYGNTQNVGDDAHEHPGTKLTLRLGDGRQTVRIVAGAMHTCARLDDGNVRCWGNGANGRLGYGNTSSIGDNEHPEAAGPVQLGASRYGSVLSAGQHSCAVMDDGDVRCFGQSNVGQLGYGNTANVGGNQHPSAVGPVDFGGRTIVAIDSGLTHSCAVLDDATVRCWGAGETGRLGYGNTANIGDDETPASVGGVPLF